MKHLIWSSEVDINDWKEDYKDAIANGIITEETDIEDYVNNYIKDSLENEIVNLDIPLEGKILVIGDLGLWNGRKSGYKIIEKRNINAILTSNHEGEIEFFSDGKNIKAICHHHDGINHYEYREIREEQINNIDYLLNRLYHQLPVTRQMINRYTKSIAPRVNKVYGW